MLNNNFALTSGVLHATKLGYYEIYGWTITSNHAIFNSVSQIFDSSTTSIIDSSSIYGNNKLSVVELIAEISVSWKYLCFLTQHFKDFLLNNPFLSTISESNYAIQLIAGSLTIRNSSKFYTEPYILNVFQSTIVIENSEFYNLSEVDNIIKISSSIVTINNIKFYDISASSTSTNALIRIAFDSVVSITGIEYYNSDTPFLLFTSSFGSIANLKVYDVASTNTNTGNMIYLDKSKSLSLTNWEIRNISQSVTDYTVKIHDSNVIELKSFNISEINHAPFESHSTNFEFIQDMNMFKCQRGLVMISSVIKDMQNSTFTNLGSSTLQSGGAIQFQDCNATIVDSQFSQNIAIEGGAISFRCSLTSFWQGEISRNTFIDNTAVKQGGALYYNLHRPIFSGNNFVNNTASYGKNIGSYAIKIKIKGNQNAALKFEDVGSGVKFDKPLILALYDHDDQIMTLDSSSQIIITGNTTNSTTLGTNMIKISSGEATFTNLIMFSKPGSQNVKFNVDSLAVDTSKLQLVYGSSYSKEFIEVNFRYCKPGEEIISGSSCKECSTGTYNFFWNSTQCAKWLVNSFCPGGSIIQVNSGYWRMTTNSTDVTKCPNKNAWKGGFSDNSKFPINWAAGYEGYLCSSCISNADVRYEQVDDFVCSKCPNPVINAFKVIGIFIGVVLFLGILITMNIRKRDVSQKSVLMRILTNHLQITTLTFAYNFQFPDFLTNMLAPLSRANSSSESVVSFDCLAKSSQLKLFTPSISILKVGISAISPLLGISMCLIFFTIMHTWAPRYFSDFKRNVVISSITLIYFLHPTITTQALGIFQCIEVGDGEKRVRMDLNISWFSREHLTWAILFGIPMIIIWVLGAPLTALYVLYKQRNNLDDSSVKRYMIVMYQGLKHKAFYWEIINVARKVILLSLNVFLPERSKTAKGGFAMIVVLVLYRTQIYIQPFTLKANNDCELLSSVATGITLFGGLIFSRDNPEAFIDFIIFLLIAFLNIKFILLWSYLMSIACEDVCSSVKKLTIILGIILNKKRDKNVEFLAPSSFKSLMKMPSSNKKMRKFKKKKSRRKPKFRKNNKGNYIQPNNLKKTIEEGNVTLVYGFRWWKCRSWLYIKSEDG